MENETEDTQEAGDEKPATPKEEKELKIEEALRAVYDLMGTGEGWENKAKTIIQAALKMSVDGDLKIMSGTMDEARFHVRFMQLTHDCGVNAAYVMFDPEQGKIKINGQKGAMGIAAQAMNLFSNYNRMLAAGQIPGAGGPKIVKP